MTTINRLSCAKINLFLHITGKRRDGYHNLQTVFRLLDWGDTLSFTPSDAVFAPKDFVKAGFEPNQCLPITLSGRALPTADLIDNLIFKASLALLRFAYQQKQTLPDHLQVIDIHLNKRIPLGAGLGGGSSNAATTLMTLNSLWQLQLSPFELISIGAKLGADIPIFIAGCDAIAEGIGDVLSPITLPKQHFLLLMPDVSVATAPLFTAPNLTRDCRKLTPVQIAEQQAAYTYQLRPPYQNVFEPLAIIKHAKIQSAMTYLRNIEAITTSTARLTGTGSCVFLPFQPQYKKLVNSHINRYPPPCSVLLTSNLSKPTP